MNNTKRLSKAKYEEMVDMTMDYIKDSKDVAKKDLETMRASMMKKWSDVSKMAMEEKEVAVKKLTKKLKTV